MNTGIQNNYLVLQSRRGTWKSLSEDYKVKVKKKRKKKDESMSTDIIALNIMKFVL